MSKGINVWCPKCLPKKVDCYGEKCGAYIGIMGKDPNTGEEGMRSGCAESWNPTLLIEQARTNRQVAAAIESFRNAMVEGVKMMLLTKAQAEMLESKVQETVDRRDLKGLVDEHKKDVVEAETK